MKPSKILMAIDGRTVHRAREEVWFNRGHTVHVGKLTRIQYSSRMVIPNALGFVIYFTTKMEYSLPEKIISSRRVGVESFHASGSL